MLVSVVIAAVVVLSLGMRTEAKLGPKPYVIGHRGACGLRPEHTLESYQLAVNQGADFIECDVVATKDCHLICRHEPELNLTTNAGDLYPKMFRTYNIDGTSVTGIFASDLTLAQVSRLRARQTRAYRNQAYNDQFAVPTLEQYLQLAKRQNRTVGVYPETKHPSWHDLKLKCFKEGSFSLAVLAALERHGYKGPVGSAAWLARPAFIQSFEAKNLRSLSRRTSIPLVQLLDEWNLPVPYDNMTYGDLTTAASLKGIAAYAAGLGPWKGSFVVANSGNVITEVNEAFVKRAHAAGLQLHPYTFRNEYVSLAWNYQSDINLEYDRFFKVLKIDGAFTDFPLTLSRYFKSNDM